MFNSKVIPKKLIDKGFVFKFESLKKIMTFWHYF
jgi:NAD dependent epimerase/dehydratase family enzyme